MQTFLQSAEKLFDTRNELCRAYYHSITSKEQYAILNYYLTPQEKFNFKWSEHTKQHSIDLLLLLHFVTDESDLSDV